MASGVDCISEAGNYFSLGCSQMGAGQGRVLLSDHNDLSSPLAFSNRLQAIVNPLFSVVVVFG
jgi:hypothetical protein